MGQRLEYVTEQIYRDVDRVRSYAYKIVGTVDPLPEDLVWLPAANTPPIGYENHVITVPNAGQSKPNQGMWAICPLCSLDFPQKAMTLVKSKYYCNENGCAEEAQSR